MSRGRSGAPPPPYPRNIRLLKGALIALESAGTSTTVPFQYNPATVKRSVRPNQLGATAADRSTAIRFTGAAVETIELEARLESVGPETGGHDPQAAAYGIHPQLAALELFAYPSTRQVSQYGNNLASGSVDVVPPPAPRLIFVWGPHRVLPVRLTGIEISEEFFDAELNPISATVALQLRVLTWSDVTPQNGDYNLFLAHQKNMERLAAYVTPSRAGTITGVNVSSPMESG